MKASIVADGSDQSFGTELIVDELYAAYDAQVVLHGVGLKVKAGSCVSVLGSNGAGKTTLMNAIAGIHRERRGRIELGGQSLMGLRGHQVNAAGVCYVPEGQGIFPDLTVTENLSISVGRSNHFHEAVYEYFPQLAKVARRSAASLSGGEQQMLAIAPALIGSYGLLLVDELSLGLSPVIVDKLFALLADIKARGVSILLVEQFAERALALSDEVYVLRKGHVVFSGAALELRGQEELLHRLYLGQQPTPGTLSEPVGEQRG